MFRTLLLVQLLKLPSSLISLHTLKYLHWLKIDQRIEYKILSLTYKILSTAQPADLHNLISVQPPDRTRSSSLITITRPSSSSSLKITDRSFHYASYPVFGIIFRLHAVNLVHHLSPPSHHPSLPLSSILDLKLTCCSTNPSHHRS